MSSLAAMSGPMGSSEKMELSNRNGSRRTIYYTKKVTGADSAVDTYARTQHYLGEWSNNKWEGKGTLDKADGTRYCGEWKAGQRDGTGTLWRRSESGVLKKVYTGQWVGGLQAGRGVMNYASGDMYNGDWLKGMRHGVGICTFADGGVYEGEWFNDKCHGFGVFDYVSGDHFEGAWVEGNKEGQGVHFYFNSEKRVHTKRYDGEWVDDRPRCGAYTEMAPDPLAPGSLIPEPIPTSQLVDPNGVLAGRLGEIRAQRAYHRAKRVSLEEYFTPEELDALQLAYSRVDLGGGGALSAAELPAAFNQVGMQPSDEELEALYAHLAKPSDGSATFSFAEFAQAADFLSPAED